MAWYDLLRKSIEKELTAGADDIIAKLVPLLGDWQKLEQVSFATAFRLQDGIIQAEADIANGLEKPADANGKSTLFQTFLDLTAKPQSDAGTWPWGLLRQGTLEKFGLFPPQILLLNGTEKKKCSSSENCLGCKTIDVTGTDAGSIKLDKKSAEFSNGADHVNLSWKWYGAYPALLGDAIRNDGKSSVALLYVLGTRREFLKQERKRDYGLMVGFTASAFDNGRCLKPAADAILAAWNLLAVAPHIVSDGERIAKLDAAQKLTHTFKTYVEAHALPALRAHCQGCSDKSAQSEAENVVRSISGLTSMMAFVAEGGVNGAIRPDVDVERYDLCAKVKNFWENYNFTVQDDCCSEGKTGAWVKWQYLQSAMLEVVRNVERVTGSASSKKVTLTCEKVDEKDQSFVIRVTNPVETQQHEGTERNVTGLKSLKVFFQALGGDATTAEEDSGENGSNKTFVTTMSYNLSAWGKINKSSQASSITQNDTSISSSSLAKSNVEIQRCDDRGKSQCRAGLRVLLLDDELAFPAVAHDGLKSLQEGWCQFETQIKAVSSNSGNNTFISLYNAAWGVEVVLCNSVISARQYLLKETFDICLVDIDFGMDLSQDKGVDGPPRLGGLLFALARPLDKRTVISIFTAKDDTLRKDPDYTYLATCAKLLGEDSPVSFSTSTKDIAEELKKAFYKWCQNVLAVPALLHPKSADMLTLSEHLSSKDKIKFLRFSKDDRHEDGDSLSFAAFDTLLDQSQKREMASLLNRRVCGHALVRHLFCNLAHADERKEAIISFLTPQNGNGFRKKEEFNQVFVDAMDLFGITDQENFATTLSEKFKRTVPCCFNIRIKLKQLVNLISNNDDNGYTDIYFYALQKEPKNFWEKVADEIKKVIIDSSNSRKKPAFKVETFKLGQDGKKTESSSYGWAVIMSANRNDNTYVNQGDGKGGSFAQLKDHLGSFAQSVFVRGPHGCYDLLAKRSVSCADCGIACGSPVSNNKQWPIMVQLGIVVRHVPATD